MAEEDDANGAAFIGSSVLYGVGKGGDGNMPCNLWLRQRLVDVFTMVEGALWLWLVIQSERIGLLTYRSK